MAERRKSPFEFSVEDLDRELTARGAQELEPKKFETITDNKFPLRETIMRQAKEFYASPPPVNRELSHVSTSDLTKIIIYKSRSDIPYTRGPWSKNLFDWYQIKKEPVKLNFNCVAAICSKDCLSPAGQDSSILTAYNYAETFNLSRHEPFRQQSVIPGNVSTGFLVSGDIVATAGHCVNDTNIDDIRFVFGYKMTGESTAVSTFPDEAVYRGVSILHRIYNPGEEDWALVKLDRNVIGHTAAVLSNDIVKPKQKVYVIGHPMGLPLKYASSPSVQEYTPASLHTNMFLANLDLYSGSSGSPVFDMETGKVIGIVANSENRDFRWTGNGWLSIIYPQGKNAYCTKTSALIDYL